MEVENVLHQNDPEAVLQVPAIPLDLGLLPLRGNGLRPLSLTPGSGT